MARVVRDALAEAPEICEPIRDPAVIERHRELVSVLMAKVIPPASWDQDYAAAIPPFHMRPFYATSPFRRALMSADGFLAGQLNLSDDAFAMGRIIKAYDAILRRFYGLELGFDYPVIATAVEPESGLARHFRLQFDPRFIEVRVRGELPRLGPEARRRLLEHRTDPAVLMEVLPPDRFVFTGLGLLKATDTTDQEVLSMLKRELIDKESIVSTVRFQGLQEQLRTLLRTPDLRLGLAALEGDQVYMLNYGCRLEHSCIFADSTHHRRADFADSIYARAVVQGQPLIVDDLAAYGARTPVEDALIDMGIRNVLVAPLYYQDQVIGTLDLGSPNPGDLTAMSALRLREVLPLFSMAVRRSLAELESRIQAVIKERCTNIHPSVEWRFRQAVLKTVERRTDAAPAEMEPIVFKDVYPLYAIADIRGSSMQRNLAIQADLTDHLRLALDVVDRAREARSLPILDELRHRLGRSLREVEATLNSGDEAGVLTLLRHEVEPLLAHLAGFGPAVRERVEAYRASLDPAIGTVYRQRKAYEAGVTLIADTVSAYIDAEEAMAQAMFPHYFEKQRTDGVDYGIYVGASLLESGEFDPLYLRNLRLWQLLVACGIARATEALRGRLAVPLETTHLVLVQHAPLSIRFRFDEKRFDVDGAYNVRYEVIKKRIDKARIRGTDERLTQPGRIAIVYSHPDEAREYRQYIDYLQASGHLTPEVEEFELEELQGVHGLRALRVGVDLTAGRTGPSPAAREAAAAVRALAP
jgi:GAF domain-containing protein